MSKADSKTLCAYNGKVVDMATYVTDPKRRFNLACMRVLDNASDGYVLDGDKAYAVRRGSRKAVLLHGDERAVALQALGRAYCEVLES